MQPIFFRKTGFFFCVEDERAAFDAVSHLVATGCRRIALVNASGTFGYARLRREGYLRALAEHDVPVDPSLMFEYRIGEDSGAEAIPARNCITSAERRSEIVSAPSATTR